MQGQGKRLCLDEAYPGSSVYRKDRIVGNLYVFDDLAKIEIENVP